MNFLFTSEIAMQFLTLIPISQFFLNVCELHFHAFHKVAHSVAITCSVCSGAEGRYNKHQQRKTTRDSKKHREHVNECLNKATVAADTVFYPHRASGNDAGLHQFFV